MTPLALLTMGGCLAVNPSSDHVTAADLAPRFPAIAAVPPDTPVGFAPAPGVARVLSTAELRRLAARLNLPSSPEDGICVTRPVAPLSAERIREAMLRTLPGARIDVVESSRQPAPEGEIEFPLNGLRSGATGALWTGYVRFAGSRRFTIWARVRVTAMVRRVIARSDLAAGRPISSADVEAVTRQEFPAAGDFASTVDEVAGNLPKTPIRAGAPIRITQLEAPKDITRGDAITVDVHVGGASLKFEATAETAGAIGQMITVRNPVSQKCFRARVEGRGRVSVDTSAAKVTP